MGGWEIFTNLASNFVHLLRPTPYFPVISKLSCFFGWIGDHTTFDALFYLKIYGSTHVSMKISDTHFPFLKKNKPTCFTHPFIFMGRKIWPPSFFQKFRKSIIYQFTLEIQILIPDELKRHAHFSPHQVKSY